MYSVPQPSISFSQTRPRKRKRVSAGPTKSIAGRVKRLEASIEHKSKDYVLNNNTSHVNNGTVIQLLEIATGDDIDEREGRRIRVESIQMRHHVNHTNTTGLGGLADFRTALVWDKFPNAGTPAYSDIYELTSFAEGENAIAPLNLKNRDRFQVIYDDCNGVGKGVTQRFGTGSSVDLIHTDNMFRKVGKMTTYGDTDKPVTGGLLLVLCASASTDSAPLTINTKAYARIRFTDA